MPDPTGLSIKSGSASSKNALRKTAAANLSLIGAATGITMVLSLALRVAISRFFGPEKMGGFYFAESMAGMFFTLLPLGIGTFISRTIPPNPASTSDYFSSICAIQVLVAAAIFLGLFGTVVLKGYPSEVIYTCLILGVYVALFRFQDTILKNVFYALGQAKLVSMVNIGVKIALVALGLAALFLHAGVPALAVAFLMSELIGCVYLLYKSYKCGFFRNNISFTQSWHIIRIGLPFYISSVLIGIYQNLGPSMLTTYGNNEETGYLGSAIRVIGICLLFIPILYNALVPLLSKVLSESKADFESFAREILEIFIVLLLPTVFALSVFGDYVTIFLYGDAFIPTQKILGNLTLYLEMSYINTICSIFALLLLQGPFFAIMSGSALILNIVVNYIAIPRGLAFWGTGGGGLGIAISVTLSEALVLLILLFKLRGTIITRRILYVIIVTSIPPMLWSIFYDSLHRLGFAQRTLIYVTICPLFLLLTGTITLGRLRKVTGLVRKFWKERRAKVVS